MTYAHSQALLMRMSQKLSVHTSKRSAFTTPSG